MLAKIKNYLKLIGLRSRYESLTMGDRCVVSQSTFGRHVRIGSRTTLIASQFSDYSYIGDDAVVCRTSIGKFCSIASGTYLGTGSHPTSSFVSCHPIFYLAKPAIGWDFVANDVAEEFRPTDIGNDVWIGARVSVRDGVRIGDGVIVGAGAVVVKDLQPYGIYVGVPASLLRYRFAPEEIEFLRELRWWDKDEQWLRAHAGKFRDVKDLMTL